MTKSPLTLTQLLKTKRVITTDNIIQAYNKSLNINVKRFFRDIENIYEYECELSGYRFYSPSSCSGDDAFYQELESLPWYYMPWKWEHEVAIKYFKDGHKVLEIGAGKGDFILNCSQLLNLEIIGLELNNSAIAAGNKKGIKLINKNVVDFSKHNKEKFDFVVSFQVLEHIHDVNLFISSCVDCLKPKGYLIISVPNNDSFIKHDELGPLNLPPHHMGLWNKKSLEYLEKLYHLRVMNFYFEPLALYHMDWYLRIMEERFLTSSLIKRIYSKSRIRILFKFLYS